jgi:hypothetical protein
MTQYNNKYHRIIRLATPETMGLSNVQIFVSDCTFLMSVKNVTPQILNAFGPDLPSGDKIRIKTQVNTRT